MKKLFFTATIALLAAAPAFAQQPAATGSEARWQPWLGCWQLLDESVQDESDVSAEEVATGVASARPARTANGTRVCVAPAAGGVTMTTMIGTERALEETVLADAKPHPIADADCRGTKRSEWSATGQRLYTSAEITCADQAPRTVSSLTMMKGGPTWVDVQMIDIGGRKSIRVRRFMRSAERAQARVAPFVGETAWTLDDIKEASAKLAPETVQAALVELRSGFNLSAKQLVSLADAGVPDGVIDLMIALSYPRKFVVSHPVSTSPSPYGRDYGGLGGGWPWIADADFWPSYYSPFAYRYWGYYDPYYVPYSGYVNLTPVTNPGGGSGPQPSGEGRVVDGRGYTRISTREPEPSIRVNNFGGSNSTMSAGGSSGSSGGSNGVSSSGGYSSGGGGGGDSGRTAVPRPPGGN